MSEIQTAMITAYNSTYKAFREAQVKRLYHYTSPDGLLGILESNVPSLYFSQYDSLNDTKERKDVFEMLQKFCDKQFVEGTMSKALYEDVLSIQPSDLFGILRKTNEELFLDSGETIRDFAMLVDEECYTYICSFSKDNDSLPMWRMYSKADHYEGFCIEFSPSDFGKRTSVRHGFSIELVKVIYEERKKMQLIESALTPVLKLYDTASKQDKKLLVSFVRTMISNFQFIFKNKAFSYEKEIRAVLHIPKAEDNYGKGISERKYRQKNGLIVPYVVYNLLPSSVRSITIAPTIKEEIAINNLRDFLNSRELYNIDIISSDIPIRNL